MTPTPIDLLHTGGTPGRWGNLGLWSPDDDYAAACRALALAVGRAADIGRGSRVLSVACGAGEELPLWVDVLHAAAVIGLEADAAQSAIAQASAGPRIDVRTGDAVAAPGLADASVDAVVCVDAAYHLWPRARWLTRMHAVLRPGGRLAFTDLVLDHGHAGSGLLRRAARACGVPIDDLVDIDSATRRLRDAGFDDIAVTRLDDAVLGGFARYVARQSVHLGTRSLGAAWRRPLATALLIPPCCAAGLGYALWSARKPD